MPVGSRNIDPLFVFFPLTVVVGFFFCRGCHLSWQPDSVTQDRFSFALLKEYGSIWFKSVCSQPESQEPSGGTN